MHPSNASFPFILAPGPSHFTIQPSIIVREDFEFIDPDEVDLTPALLRFRVNASLDNATMSASITFRIQGPLGSLSPFVSASPYYTTFPNGPVLRPNNQVDLAVVCSPAGDSFRIFSGRIDRVSLEANGEEVTVTCRDNGGYLLNYWIETDTKKGGTPTIGQPVEEVMNEILNIHGWAGLHPSSGSPGWDVLEYPQEKMPILEALRRIAQQFGWDIRWFPTNGTGVSVRLYDPGRDRTTPDLTLGAGRYESITELGFGDEDVRNVWDLWYPGPDGLPLGPVHAESASSIAKYDRRYAQIYLNRAENIRTVGAAGFYLSYVMLDTNSPFASHAIRAPLLPMVELNDIHKYTANGIHYDTDQQLAVVAYTHEYANGHGTTSIQARGAPIAAYRDYRRSVPPKILAATAAPTDEYAPEGTLLVVVDSLAFPV